MVGLGPPRLIRSVSRLLSSGEDRIVSGGCVTCGETEGVELDAHSMCFSCRIRSTAGPDLTCAILGRGDQGNEIVRGLDRQSNVVGCCQYYHASYDVGEVWLADGRWAEVCCMVQRVQRALSSIGRLRWTPFGESDH